MHNLNYAPTTFGVLNSRENKPASKRTKNFECKWFRLFSDIPTPNVRVTRRGYVVVQLVEALRCKPEGRGFDYADPSGLAV